MPVYTVRVETNVFEACANGASIAGKTVAAVIVNYIAFLGLLAWVNATLAWFGERVGYDNLSFEVSFFFIKKALHILIYNLFVGVPETPCLR